MTHTIIDDVNVLSLLYSVLLFVLFAFATWCLSHIALDMGTWSAPRENKWSDPWAVAWGAIYIGVLWLTYDFSWWAMLLAMFSAFVAFVLATTAFKSIPSIQKGK